MLQVRKVMEHVYEKIINLDTESPAAAAAASSGSEKPGDQEKDEDVTVLAEEKIELMCQDQVRNVSNVRVSLHHYLSQYITSCQSEGLLILFMCNIGTFCTFLQHFGAFEERRTISSPN